jgi:hypothetical protein
MGLFDDPKRTIVTLVIITMTLYFFIISAWYAITQGQYNSSPESIKSLITAQTHSLNDSFNTHGISLNESVCSKIHQKDVVYTTLQKPLVNWRPLTVRLAGYLGGLNKSPRNGVFSEDDAVKLALKSGARAFVFDINYMNKFPCKPVIMYRDSGGIKRSLNTGSINAVCTALEKYAFKSAGTQNSDPIIIIVYLNRVPSGTNQRKTFLSNVASSLSPLSKNHLGLTEQGNYHSCKMESNLFTNDITYYQQKFIVLTNYNTADISPTQNPMDNLHFWTNARIYQDDAYYDSSLGTVTPLKQPAPTSHAVIGSTAQYLQMPTATKPTYRSPSGTSFSKFVISLADPAYPYTVANVNQLMNETGIQCVPLDVLTLTATQNYVTSKTSTPALSSTTISTATNTSDPMSFWIYAGWSPKPQEARQGFLDYKEGFESVPAIEPASPIPVFVRPKPIIPKAPSQATNSNGGLVGIS